MSQKLTCFLLLFVAVTPWIAQADWQCSGWCEFHSTNTQSKGPGFVEIVNLKAPIRVHGEDFSQISKYRVKKSASGESQDSSFSKLQSKCMDTASANSDYLFAHTDYAPKAVDEKTFQAISSKGACSSQ
jgi:hypothetical protein